MNEDLERLKKALHPEKNINIVEQCRIVHEALAVGGDFQGQRDKLATYLEISPEKVYKMQRAHKDASPELKEWFKGTEYQVNTYYDKSVLPEDAQRVFLRDMRMLVTGSDSSDTSITEEKQ